MGVRVGVWWCDTYPQGSHFCKQPNLSYTGHVANTFMNAMRSYGHDDIFNYGNDNAWSSDFDHPDHGGSSLTYIDNVHFCYWGGHGGHAGFDGKRVEVLAFSSIHNPPNLAPCFTMSAQWRLGVKLLKWLLLDSCVLVKTTDAAHVVEVWGPPTQGVHVVMGFIDLQRVGPATYNRRVSFVDQICRGQALGPAWLDTAYSWEDPAYPANRPIVIAGGVDRDDAIRRRDSERLDWLYHGLLPHPVPIDRPAQIYRLAPPQTGQRAVFGLARRFGLAGNLDAGGIQQDAHRTVYREGSSELEFFHASGGMRFHDTARWQVDDGEANLTYDDATAVRAAQGYIDEFALAEREDYRLLRVSRLNVAVAQRATGQGEQRVIDVGVAFQRVVDGLPVLGPGGRIVVYLDHERNLTGVDRVWREIEDVHRSDVELRSPAWAMREARTEWGEDTGGLLAFDDIRLGYFERDWIDNQAYLQPAYLLPGTLTATGGLFAGR